MVGDLRATVHQHDRRHIGRFASCADVSGTRQGKRGFIAATFVGIISLGNGLGRVLWAWISDLTSRKTAFFAMYLTQAVIFWNFHSISSPTILLVASFIILVCYGGVEGIIAILRGENLGLTMFGPIFGLMMLPWAFPAAFGPLLFAYLRQSTGGYNEALYLIAGVLTVAMILPVLVSPPRKTTLAEEAPAAHRTALRGHPWNLTVRPSPCVSASSTQHMAQCMEVWGGSQLTSRGVAFGGLDAWVYSKPYGNAQRGGDVYYASSCATGRISRLLLADVSGHGTSVAATAADLRTLMRRSSTAWIRRSS